MSDPLDELAAPDVISSGGEDFSAFGAKWYVVGANGKKIEPPGES